MPARRNNRKFIHPTSTLLRQISRLQILCLNEETGYVQKNEDCAKKVLLPTIRITTMDANIAVWHPWHSNANLVSQWSIRLGLYKLTHLLWYHLPYDAT
jgi:hypothetical protein